MIPEQTEPSSETDHPGHGKLRQFAGPAASAKAPPKLDVKNLRLLEVFVLYRLGTQSPLHRVICVLVLSKCGVLDAVNLRRQRLALTRAAITPLLFCLRLLICNTTSRSKWQPPLADFINCCQCAC